MSITSEVDMNTIQMILNYNGTNNFMLSLQSQAIHKGTHRLSDKQLAAAERFFNPETKQQVKEFTYKPQDAITIRKWFANGKMKELGLKLFFRNLIIEEVVNETAKAVQVKVRFNSKITTCCHICGLNLDNEISKATGIGPICAKRLGFGRVSMADADAILAKVEEEAKIAGVIGPIWIPKSQIMSKMEQVLFEKE